MQAVSANFSFFAQRLSWVDALSFCIGNGGTFARILSPADHEAVVLLTGGSDESQSLVSESMSARSHRREHWKTKWTVAPAEVLTPSETEKENESGPHTSVCMLTWADSTSGGDTGARHAVRQVPLLQIVRLALVSQSSTSSHQAHVPLGGETTLQKRREPVIGLDGHG